MELFENEMKTAKGVLKNEMKIGRWVHWERLLRWRRALIAMMCKSL